MEKKTLLSKANLLFKNGNYSEALVIYSQLRKEQKWAKSLDLNIKLCYDKINESLPNDSKSETTDSEKLDYSRKNVAIFTIVAKNYLHYAQTLLKSVKLHNPDYKLYIFLADEFINTEESIFKSIDFQILEAKTIGIPNFRDMVLRYDVMEFSTAIKPFAMRWLFEKYHFDQVVYLDPDICVYRSLSELEEIHSKGYNAILTPHLTIPYKDRLQPDDHAILKSGVFNLGFASFSNCSNSLDFINWWAEKLRDKAKSDLANNLFTDQRWCDFAPCLIDNLFVLKNPSYNLAYWNLHERALSKIGGNYYVDREPLKFFHFSGINAKNPTLVSKHQNRYNWDNIEPLHELFESYRLELINNGYDLYSKMACVYDSLKTLSVSKLIHDFYSNKIPESRVIQAEDLDRYVLDLCISLATNSDLKNGIYLTSLMSYIFEIRKDLKDFFSLSSGNGVSEFINWAVESIPREYKFNQSSFFESRSINTITKFYSSDSNNKLSELLLAIYEQRDDLKKSIDINTEQGLASLNSWAKNSIINEYKAHDDFFITNELGVNSINGSLGVNVIGYLYGESGLGERCRVSCDALKEAKIDLVGINYEIGYSSSKNANFNHKISKEENPNIVNIFHINADQLLNVYLHLGPRFFVGKYNIAFFAWELEVCPQRWEHAIKVIDEIWVPSQFVANAFGKLTSKPIFVMPEPIRRADKAKPNRAKFDLPKSGYIFLSVFDVKSYIDRKNPMAAILAFKKAFKDNDNVFMVIKTLGLSENNEARNQLIKEIGGDERFIIFDKTLSGEDYYEFLNSIDSLVSLHRAEGFGRCPAEAMMLGKPVVITNYSGVTEYATSENSCLVDYKLIPVLSEQYPFAEGNFWADPDIEHAAYLMNKLYSDLDYRSMIATNAEDYVFANLSPKSIGLKYKERLTKLGAI